MLIITDSASDITSIEAKEMGIEVVPLSIMFGEDNLKMETEEDFNYFFDRLATEEELPKTSQPSPEMFLNLYKSAEERQEEVLVITLSSGLSGTYNSACLAQELSGYDKIHVVDSKNAIQSQRFLVERAVDLRDSGKSVAQIESAMLDLRERVFVGGVLDTLTYLAKGGRMPKTIASVGNILNLKPVIECRNKVLVMLGISRGRKGGKKILWKQFEKFEKDPEEFVYFGYTRNRELGQEFMQETVEKYGIKKYCLTPIGGVIGTHVGANGLSLCFLRKEKVAY